MDHPIYRVTAVETLDGYRLRVVFDDGLVREVDLERILDGELYGPLRDRSMFDGVRVDPEVHTLVWPNGADFDPATLHDWPLGELAFADGGISEAWLDEAERRDGEMDEDPDQRVPTDEVFRRARAACEGD